MKTRFDRIDRLEPQSSDYGSDPVNRWKSADSFFSAEIRVDGVHVIRGAQGNEVEFLLGGQPFEECVGPVLVVFSGAVTKRSERTPPFFSGRGIAEKTGVPFIAISDPTLSIAPDLNIGWYSGTQTHDVQAEIEAILRPLSERIGRDLWLVGGSAGAFAAMEMGHRLGRRSSVFVWNPQTDIAEYSPPLVRAYSTRAFSSHAQSLSGREWKPSLRDVMSYYGRRRSLMEDFLPSQSPGRLLYLQSASDWHVQKHCGPYLDAHDYRRQTTGLWVRTADQVVWLANTGQGHAPPSTDKIVDIVQALVRTKLTVLEVVTQWREQQLFPAPDAVTCPDDLRAVAEWVEASLDCRLEGDAVTVTSAAMAPGLSGLHADVEVLDPDGTRLSGASNIEIPGTWAGELPRGPLSIEVLIRDGLNHPLAKKSMHRPEGTATR